MFVDRVLVELKAGDGGKGLVSFRREKFVDKGGPDGGDGGDGGDIIFGATNNINALTAYRYKKQLAAGSGSNGDKRKKHGKNGEDLHLAVPVGTVITNEAGEVLADLVGPKDRVPIANGGRGGFGNAHFTSSTRQAPRVAEKGEAGEELVVSLELKMIADVGLIGLPNAGKSTLLASISNARPEIADYPFTTLSPNLGVVDIDKSTSLLFADIPGLIEGASKGKGLGDEFLRHIERTAVLVHLIDIYQDDTARAYETINSELEEYSVDLTKKPQIVVLSKIDGLDKDIIRDKEKQLKKALPRGCKLFTISAKNKAGLNDLLYETAKIVDKERKKQAKKASGKLPIITFKEPETTWSVDTDGSTFIVSGKKIERFAQRTDFDNPHGVRRLRDIMRKMGIISELEKRGIKPGQKIHIGSENYEIEY